jgi:hypothetical protein
MASFSTNFPFAYHVLPLHALKSVVASGQLLSKNDREQAGLAIQRATTAAVDRVLGLAGFVHFYLPETQGISFNDLSILNAQLGRSIAPPFPHVVLVIPTNTLTDDVCTICNFNAAVSRPAYRGVRGGNHARGTAAEIILGHWQGFKQDDPGAERMRRSFWHDEIAVPLLSRNQITQHPSNVGYNAPHNTAELLLSSPFVLETPTFYCFSKWDRDSVAKIPANEFAIQSSDPNPFGWYAEQDRVTPAIRQQIYEYFDELNRQMPEFNFDMHRPMA